MTSLGCYSSELHSMAAGGADVERQFTSLGREFDDVIGMLQQRDPLIGSRRCRRGDSSRHWGRDLMTSLGCYDVEAVYR